MYHFLAQSNTPIVINPNIPFVSSGSTIGGLIQGFYLFALAFSGILAFGAIVYGGIKYATGRGNPSAESEGKSWVTNALLGLLLLGGAYIVLQTVNPGLTVLSLPNLQSLGSAASASVPGTGSGGNGNLSAAAVASCGGCPNGGTCSSSGSCVGTGGIVYCSPGTNAQCPSATQTCINQGSATNLNYQCVTPVTPATATCGGVPPNSHYGTCPSPSHCVNVNGGLTVQTVQYGCR